MCFGFDASGTVTTLGEFTCPLGTSECASFNGAALPASRCDDCLCPVADGTCATYYPGTAMCPAGSAPCQLTGSTVLDSCRMPDSGSWVTLHAPGTDASEDYSLRLGLSPPSDALDCTAALETQPCAGARYIPGGACLQLTVSLGAAHRRSRARALQGSSNGTVVLNGTLTVGLPQGVAALLANGSTVVLVSRSQLAGEADAPRCQAQMVSLPPATIVASDCGADDYVLLLTSKDADVEGMLAPPKVQPPSPGAGSGLAIALAVCGVVVVVVALAVVAARRHRSRHRIEPVKAGRQSIVVSMPVAVPLADPPAANNTDSVEVGGSGDSGEPAVSVVAVSAWLERQSDANLRSDHAQHAALPQSASLALPNGSRPTTSESVVKLDSNRPAMPPITIRNPGSRHSRRGQHPSNVKPRSRLRHYSSASTSSHDSEPGHLPSTVDDPGRASEFAGIASVQQTTTGDSAASQLPLPLTGDRSQPAGRRRLGTPIVGSTPGSASTASRRRLWESVVLGADPKGAADDDDAGQDSITDFQVATAHSHTHSHSRESSRLDSAGTAATPISGKRPVVVSGPGVAGLDLGGDVDVPDDLEEISVDGSQSTSTTARARLHSAGGTLSGNTWVVTIDDSGERLTAVPNSPRNSDAVASEQAAGAGERLQYAVQHVRPRQSASPEVLEGDDDNDDVVSALFGMPSTATDPVVKHVADHSPAVMPPINDDGGVAVRRNSDCVTALFDLSAEHDSESGGGGSGVGVGGRGDGSGWRDGGGRSGSDDVFSGLVSGGRGSDVAIGCAGGAGGANHSGFGVTSSASGVARVNTDFGDGGVDGSGGDLPPSAHSKHTALDRRSESPDGDAVTALFGGAGTPVTGINEMMGVPSSHRTPTPAVDDLLKMFEDAGFSLD